MRSSLTLLILVCGVVFVAMRPASVHAQVGRSSSLDLSRPTLSPYLDYFRLNTGALPRYHQYVRPRQRILADRRQSWQAIGFLQTGVTRNTQRFEAGLQGQPQVRGTGLGGSYMNYLHFYPGYSRRR